MSKHEHWSAEELKASVLPCGDTSNSVSFYFHTHYIFTR